MQLIKYLIKEFINKIKLYHNFELNQMKFTKKTWSRVRFKINRLNGTISKKFNPENLKNKVTEEEVVKILIKLEKETNNFHFLRFYTQFKIIILICIIILTLTGILLFAIVKDFTTGMILVSIACLFALLLLYLSFPCYKNGIRPLAEIVNENIFMANENIFLQRRLYMLADKEYRFIVIYIVPLAVNLGVLIHNSLIVNRTNPIEEFPSIQEIINLKKNGSLGNKFTNMRKNYITDF
jgi:hypothetical protein